MTKEVFYDKMEKYAIAMREENIGNVSHTMLVSRPLHKEIDEVIVDFVKAYGGEASLKNTSFKVIKYSRMYFYMVPCDYLDGDDMIIFPTPTN